MTRTPQDFIAAYEAALAASVSAHPEKYRWTADRVPEMAEKMIRALRNGTADLSPTVKAVAKEFGVKPTRRDIRLFLNA